MEKSGAANDNDTNSDEDKKPAADPSTDNNDSDDESEEEIIACCLCHCSVDYADKEAFFGPRHHHHHNGSSTTSTSSGSGGQDGKNGSSNGDSNESDKNEETLLPTELYDPHNNIVFCDGCDRPYHQKCHFVPLISLPRGDWHCLICRYQRDFTHKQSGGRASKKKQKQHRNLTTAQLKQIYHSPPSTESTPSELREWQQVFEFETSQLKAQLLKKELTVRLLSGFQQQLAQIRHAENTLRAYTSTHRARQFLSKKSQELSQTLCKLAWAKLRIRTLFLSVNKILFGPKRDWIILQKWLESQDESERLKWFPFGRNHERRIVPRFEGEEAIVAAASELHQQQQHSGGVPSEVVLTNSAESKMEDEEKESKSEKDAAAASCSAHATSAKDKSEHKGTDEDDEEMISLDDLRCCVCFKGDASDENDVLLCDGQGCFRAYHMNCVSPHVSAEEAQDEDKDWFCPICNAIGKFLFDVQSEYMGHEWEERRHQRHYKRAHGEKDDDIHAGDDDEESVKSWAQASDVFPDAEKELAVATKWKKGFRDAETDALISSVLGINMGEDAGSNDIDDSEDVDDDSDDDDFNLQAFKTEKQETADDSTVSSDATLADMSIVEYEIDRNELDALSCSSNGSDDEEASEASSRRPRRRTRASRARSASGDDSSSERSSKPDIGTLDESNIIRGKRNRTKVDYRRLNDAMFGMIDDEEAVKLFDDRDDEFRLKNGSAKKESGKGKRGRPRKRASESEDEDEESDVKSRKAKKKTLSVLRKRAAKTNTDKDSDDNSEPETKPSRSRKPKRATEAEKSGKNSKLQKAKGSRARKRASKAEEKSDYGEPERKQTQSRKSKRATKAETKEDSEPEKARRGGSRKRASKPKAPSNDPREKRPKRTRRRPRKPYETSSDEESSASAAPTKRASSQSGKIQSTQSRPRKRAAVSSGDMDDSLQKKRKRACTVKRSSFATDNESENSAGEKIPAKSSPPRKPGSKSRKDESKSKGTGTGKRALQNGYNDKAPPKRTTRSPKEKTSNVSK